MPRRVVIHRDKRVSAASEALGEVREKRQYCWQIAGCSEAQRRDCYAFFAGQNCWDLWALRPHQRKRCCRKRADCRECPIWQAKFPTTLVLHVPVRPSSASRSSGPVEKMCPHLAGIGKGTMLGSGLATAERIAVAEVGSLRCRLRGAYLAEDYVSDVCATRNYRDCIFLEDE